jgi:phage baseplate assembly protein W
MTTIIQKYSDIDFAFNIRPVVGDIALSYNQQAVIRSVRNLLLTNHFERLFNPDIGSNLTGLLFENINQSTTVAIENEIRNTINNYEPRVTIDSIAVSALPDQNAYSVRLTFYINNISDIQTVTVLLERNR